jgi:hypothetical protein
MQQGRRLRQSQRCGEQQQFHLLLALVGWVGCGKDTGHENDGRWSDGSMPFRFSLRKFNFNNRSRMYFHAYQRTAVQTLKRSCMGILEWVCPRELGVERFALNEDLPDTRTQR